MTTEEICNVPEPCNSCAYGKCEDLTGTGRVSSWCSKGHDQWWGDPECPFQLPKSEEVDDEVRRDLRRK